MKKVKQIQRISIQRMDKGSHYQFLGDVVIVAEDNEAIMEKVPSLVEQLKAALTDEAAAFQVSRKSFVVDDIQKLEKRFNQCFRSYKKGISAYKNFPDKELSDAAVQLDQHLKDYRIRLKDKRTTKMGLTMSFLNNLEENYATQVEKLHLGTIVAQLKEVNDQLFTCFEQRLNELQVYPLRALQSARAVSDDAYKELVRQVNALAVVEGDEAFGDFIDLMNVKIKSYKSNL